jgi:hypothetical protein
MNFFSEYTLEDLHAECSPYAFLKGWPTQDEVLFGEWWEESYEGAFHLIWRKNGVLYMLENSHCSCNGFYEDYGPSDNVSCKANEINGQYLVNLGHPYWLRTDEQRVAWDAMLEAVV